MTFILSLQDSYFWPVKIELPKDGRFEQCTFDAEFKRLPQDRVNEIMVMAQRLNIAVENKQDLDGLLKDVEIADEVLCGWKGILDDANKQVPFSETMKATLLQIPGIAASITQAWVESTVKGKAKN